MELEETNSKSDEMINEKDIETSRESSVEDVPEVEIKKVYVNID